jgi:ubiquinone/menaquinone biosynthesis C-methylase UbiE
VAPSAYDAIAEWYDAWLGSASLADDTVFAAVESLMGDVEGLRVCDLACGQGRVARHLADRGALVTGIDSSVRLLKIARGYEARYPERIEYRHDDVRALNCCAAAEFDAVVCFMALMDIADLEPTVRSVHRVLRPGGWFVFAVLHPCFNTARSDELTTADGLVRTIGSYFVEGHWQSDRRTGPPGKVGAYHRTLSTYFNTLLAQGFEVQAVAEPVASGRRAELRPIWTEVPSALVVRCAKSRRTQ